MIKPSHERLLQPGQAVRRRPAVNLYQFDERLFSHEYVHETADCFLREYRSITVFSDGTLARGLETSGLATRSAQGALSHMKRIVKLVRRYLTTKECRRSTLWLITDKGSGGYFHWVGDVLPRLELLLASGLFDAEKDVLIIPDFALLPYARQCLEALGVHFEASASGERVKARRLLVVTDITGSGNYDPGLMQAIRARYHKLANVDSLSPPRAERRRLYISRSKAARRKIENESELVRCLETFGVERVFLEDYSFLDQVALFANCEFAIGLHGAGLANFAWMPRGARVLEIRFQGDNHNNCYFSLASALELDYFYFLAIKHNNELGMHECNAIVDVSRLEETLAIIAAQHQTESQ